MADDTIQYMKGLNEIQPDQPFLVYYVPRRYPRPPPSHPGVDRQVQGQVRHGLERDARRDFRQSEEARRDSWAWLTPWPKDLPTWDSLAPEDKRLFAHQAEVYGAFLAYTDSEIGRVIQAVQDMGKLDDTLVIYISGDNGASPEGTTTGTFNEVAAFNGVNLPAAEQMKFYDAWGSDKTYPHYGRWMGVGIQYPVPEDARRSSHFGGTRQGVAMAWPARIKDAWRDRPTSSTTSSTSFRPSSRPAVSPQPQQVDGDPAEARWESVSMTYTWDGANASAPTRHPTQYFEMFATRAICDHGWVAAAPLAGPAVGVRDEEGAVGPDDGLPMGALPCRRGLDREP